VVINVVDSFPDLPPAELEKKEEVFWGNSITVEYEEFHVILARLKENSITVREGDTLETGQVIGEIGNSGFIGGPFSINLEPHLHIHVSQKSERENFPYEREGVPVLLGEKFLVKNMLVESP
jgi:murein DD-endopeptidase MepM/ murein hydrolase activator NlpD